MIGNAYKQYGTQSSRSTRVSSTRSTGGLSANYLAKQAAKASQSARADSLSQYKSLMDSAKQTTDNTRGLNQQAQAAAASVGEQAKVRAGQHNEQQLAKSQQSLVSRGLGNTTIAGAASRGINADYAQNLGNIDEQQAKLRSGLLTQAAGAEMALGNFNADAILSRQNVGPDLGMYSSLLQSLSAGAF